MRQRHLGSKTARRPGMFLVYWCCALTRKLRTVRWYCGATAVYPGEDVEAALERRKLAHSTQDGDEDDCRGALWMRFCVPGSFKITLVDVFSTWEAALKAELSETVRAFSAFAELCYANCRGGPYCYLTLPPEVCAELRSVIEKGGDFSAPPPQGQSGELRISG